MVQFRRMQPLHIREKAIAFRQAGKTYDEIARVLLVPKSTLSVWLHKLELTADARSRLLKRRRAHNKFIRSIAHAVHKKKRRAYLLRIDKNNKNLFTQLENPEVAKLALAILYQAEGTKSGRSWLTFGNSDPAMIRLFLRLLSHCYVIDKSRFRCTVQCRADQNIEYLESFWSRTTRIPPAQFYKTRIDPRSVGKPSKNHDYKGVCRIDYFSADVFNDLRSAIINIFKGR